MERLFLKGVNPKNPTQNIHLFLPNVKQPVALPNKEPDKSIEKRRRSHIFKDKTAISKLIMEAVHEGKGHWFPESAIKVEAAKINVILGRHPFPLCQGPIVLPLDNNAGWDFVNNVKLSNNEVLENRTLFTHADEQECFEWIPSLIGINAWNPERIKDQIHNLQVPVSCNNLQGPASTKTMGIVYTCNKST